MDERTVGRCCGQGDTSDRIWVHLMVGGGLLGGSELTERLYALS
jgi:hypothetical protein